MKRMSFLSSYFPNVPKYEVRKQDQTNEVKKITKEKF